MGRSTLRPYNCLTFAVAAVGATAAPPPAPFLGRTAGRATRLLSRLEDWLWGTDRDSRDGLTSLLDAALLEIRVFIASAPAPLGARLLWNRAARLEIRGLRFPRVPDSF